MLIARSKYRHMISSSFPRKRLAVVFAVITTLLLLFILLSIPTLMVVHNFLYMFLEPFPSFCSSIDYYDYYDYHTRGMMENNNNNSTIDVYIPGAGFSGFFYTLGRLHHLHQKNNLSSSSSASSFHYYCFSAGCLALLTSTLKIPLHSTLKIAHASRNRWIAGEISRYEVVQHFLDGLLAMEEEEEDDNNNALLRLVSLERNSTNATISSDSSACYCENDYFTQEYVIDITNYTSHAGDILVDFLPRMNVITTSWDAQNHSFSQSTRRPTSIKHLKELLIQTTWIPFITGDTWFWKNREDDTIYHNDGAFAGLFRGLHPSISQKHGLADPRNYHYSLLLPWSYDLLSNGLNLNLDQDKAVHYWEEGYKKGVMTSL